MASVPSNEGFWIRAKEREQIWVQMLVSGESPIQVVEAQKIGLRGRVVPNPQNSAEQFGLTASEGAERLERARYHIEAKPTDIRVEGDRKRLGE